MGCGKTTIGSAVATELGVPFTDLDDYIEERCQARIGEIFTQMGEARFRKIEQQALAEAIAKRTAIEKAESAAWRAEHGEG